MRDTEKTSEQLVAELDELQRQIKELKKSEAESRLIKEELKRHKRDLNERVKELNCLYKINEFIRKREITTEEFLGEVVRIIQSTWQYPEITEGCIVFDGRTYQTNNFKETKWMQIEDIIINNKKAGCVKVCYLEKKPESDEGPFLKEERYLIRVIAEQLGQLIALKRAEEALRESEEFTSNLLRHSPFPILVINPDTSIRYVNTAFENLTGFSSDEIILRKPPFPWWIEEILKKTSRAFDKAFKKGTEKVEMLFQKRNGKRFWVEITALPVVIEGKFQYHLSSWMDITDRKLAEERLKENQRKLEASEAELKNFSRKILSIREEEKKNLSAVLHDELGSLAVGLSSSLASVKQDVKDNTLKNALETIAKSQTTLKKCVSRLKSIAADLRPPDLDIMGLHGVLGEYFLNIQEYTDIQINFKVNKKKIRSDDRIEIAIYRIVQESLNNIIKHANANRVDVSLFFKENEIKLDISDNGKGFNINRSINRIKRRLGLRGMREMAESLNGTFKIFSEPGMGTEISVRFPVEKGDKS